jgi:hypothetical protein
MVGATHNQAQSYGYIMLKLETEYSEVLNYLTDLLLCSGRGGELWGKYSIFKTQVSLVWKGLHKAGVGYRRSDKHSNSPSLSPIVIGDQLINDKNESVSITSQPLWIDDSSESVGLTSTAVNNTLLNFLESARPSQRRQPRSPLLIGLGLGFLGTYLFGQYFGNNNDHEIELLNNNIQKQNQNIRVTNERIDILAKNVSNSVNVLKNILDKLVDAQETADIHYAILWNLDQLIASITDIRNSFKFSELTVTLLSKGILNAELIDLTSFERIVIEGLKSFPELEFPLAISRYQLTHLVKIIKIQRIARLKFLMVIPLTRKQDYEVFSLIPHPVKLGPTDLVLPELQNVILIDEHTYILTTKNNVYSVSLDSHVLLDVEPMYNKITTTCEWEGFKQNSTAMLEICNYKKIGQLKDTFVVETDKHRLVYFSEQTKVSLDCPEKNVVDTLIGLHRLPLACDITTDSVFWPAKQTVTIAIESNETNSFGLDSTYLPIISVNRTSKLHSSLRELIAKLPKETDSFTIDFDQYDLTLEKIQTVSIFVQSFLTIIVVINSVLIGFLFAKWFYNKKQNNNHTQKSFVRGIRDSVRIRKNNLNKRDSLRNVRENILSRGRDLRDSIRSKGSSIRQRIKDKIPDSHRLTMTPIQVGASSSLHSPPTNTNAGTNTDVNWQLPTSVIPEMYPALPRYM